ncbi:LOW QUALITY PROTEIN: hypothetical protein ACHAWF_018295 [Thalassiosira exigua]
MASEAEAKSDGTGGGNKRHKPPPPNPCMILDDLPRETLENVGEFLPKPSRALFAAAMTAPSPSWQGSGGVGRPSAASSVVLGSSSLSRSVKFADDWAVLDFGEVEEGLASKLTDDDICGVLMAIDAVNNVKRLKLAGCVNIFGKGLEPLRNSIVLEQIDLSLISGDAVDPILTSIVGCDGCSLKHIRLPQKWSHWNQNEDLKGFLQLYDRYLQVRLRGHNCFNCEQLVRESTLTMDGIQKNTCVGNVLYVNN